MPDLTSSELESERREESEGEKGVPEGGKFTRAALYICQHSISANDNVCLHGSVRQTTESAPSVVPLSIVPLLTCKPFDITKNRYECVHDSCE